MANFIAWSYSRLKTFTDCPKQFYHLNVARKGAPDRIPFEQSQPMLDGQEIDNALTARIATGTPLPEKYRGYEGMVAAILASPGAKFTQMQLALDQALEPCGYKDWDKAWVRVIYDVAVIDGERAFLGDWKNGQIWLDERQLKLFATVGFHQFPEVQTIDTSYIWLKHGKTSDKTYRRHELPDLWNDFIPDVERLQVANANNHWPAEPRNGKRTCKWCPVNKARLCDKAAGPFGK